VRDGREKMKKGVHGRPEAETRRKTQESGAKARRYEGERAGESPQNRRNPKMPVPSRLPSKLGASGTS
jgi:hypothetical protein